MKIRNNIKADPKKQAELHGKLNALLEEYQQPVLVMYGLVIDAEIDLTELNHGIVVRNKFISEPKTKGGESV